MSGRCELSSRAKRNERLTCKELTYLHRVKSPDNELPEPQENPVFQQYFTLFLPGISVSAVGEAEVVRTYLRLQLWLQIHSQTIHLGHV